MELDDVDDALEQVQRDLAALTTKHDTLKRDHDQLSGKLRSPGTKFLVDLEYKLVHESTVAVAAGTVVVGSVFETLPGALHAVYVLSAYAPASNTPVVITDGSVIVAPANAVSVAIQRKRASSGTQLSLQAAVIYDNTGAVSVDVAVRVWRRLGMGS